MLYGRHRAALRRGNNRQPVYTTAVNRHLTIQNGFPLTNSRESNRDEECRDSDSLYLVRKRTHNGSNVVTIHCMV